MNGYSEHKCKVTFILAVNEDNVETLEHIRKALRSLSERLEDRLTDSINNFDRIYDIEIEVEPI